MAQVERREEQSKRKTMDRTRPKYQANEYLMRSRDGRVAGLLIDKPPVSASLAGRGRGIGRTPSLAHVPRGGFQPYPSRDLLVPKQQRWVKTFDVSCFLSSVAPATFDLSAVVVVPFHHASTSSDDLHGPSSGGEFSVRCCTVQYSTV